MMLLSLSLSLVVYGLATWTIWKWLKGIFDEN